MSEFRTIARHATTVLVGQLAVMAAGALALLLLAPILAAILWRSAGRHSS